MKHRLLIVAAGAALALSACATTPQQYPDGTVTWNGIPRGPSLSYEQLLPNTHENPTWARPGPHYQVQNGKLQLENPEPPSPGSANAGATAPR